MAPTESRPIIAITMGDAAGIGPEIIIKALSAPKTCELCRPFVVGDMSALDRAEHILSTGVKMRAIRAPEEAGFQCGVVDCLDLGLLPDRVPFGHVSAVAGHAAYSYLVTAIDLALESRVQAICTAPLNKEALHLGGHMYPGHTEILAERSGTTDFAMMFSSPELRVILVTIHDGLLDAIGKITPASVYRTIRLAHDTLRRAGIDRPRIAVCGINPHAGENGLFGNREEEERILPAIRHAQGDGIDAHGPLPGDTAFYLARRGDYDIVAAMYHDQGLGPMKVLGLESAVNITVGLPFVRTSVDHGTAFDIAGKGTADARNMIEAIRQAAILSASL
jgi:4-phospho-D-threonate 3-dehydrogenase / 4-phospho-D-erythronate 3-dehydrogenase